MANSFVKYITNSFIYLMKKALFLAFSFSFSTITAQSYQEKAANYTKEDLKSYTYDSYSDKHNPTLLALSNLILPGLGQFIAGENKRGWLFVGGYAASLITIIAGSATEADIYNPNTQTITPGGAKTPGLLAIGALGVLTTTIWSMIDSNKVAKINNMYIKDRDQKKASNKISLEPNIVLVKFNDSNYQTLGIKLRF